jgi:ABC-type nitrate/sulfonate/bicarbonate transport system substrate-binding protein
MLAVVLALSGPLPALAQAPPPSPPPSVKVGETAPDFTLPYVAAKAEGGFETRQLALSSFKGKQNVVLAFFPSAFSPG